MGKDNRLHVRITPEDQLLLRDIAQSMGYTVDRGIYVGSGSVSAFLTAFARGRVDLAALDELFRSGLVEMPAVPDGQMSLPRVHEVKGGPGA